MFDLCLDAGLVGCDILPCPVDIHNALVPASVTCFWSPVVLALAVKQYMVDQNF
jgi:hypothetical protein